MCEIINVPSESPAEVFVVQKLGIDILTELNCMAYLAKERGKIVEYFLHIDQLLNAIVLLFYEVGKDEDFILDVLYDEYFSTGLKIKILKKLYIKLNIKDKKHITNFTEKLFKLNQIRNYFVHCNLCISEELVDVNKIDKNMSTIDPRDHTKYINFDELYKYFFLNNIVVENELIEVYKNMGGKVVNN